MLCSWAKRWWCSRQQCCPCEDFPPSALEEWAHDRGRGLVLTGASCCWLHFFRSNSRKCLRSYVFSNNLQVCFLLILLIINGLWRFLKVRLPIFSCNLALAFRAKTLSVSSFCRLFSCRLFHFWLHLFLILTQRPLRIYAASNFEIFCFVRQSLV